MNQLTQLFLERFQVPTTARGAVKDAIIAWTIQEVDGGVMVEPSFRLMAALSQELLVFTRDVDLEEVAKMLTQR